MLQIPNLYYLSEPAVTTAFADKATTAVKQSKSVSIEINVTRNKLYVYTGSTIVKSFDIASGKRLGLTPIGSFEIVTKLKNPWYLAKEIPGGDPKNPLGSRWLGLSVPNTAGTKYGIHGTNAPSSIGKNASGGCIRMNNKDVEWLFDTIPTGTKVKIHA
nr:L,D-transpeptidase [Paenibacillus sp. OV219]